MAKTAADIESQIKTILNEEWNVRESTEVPSTDSVAHKNGAVKIEAAFLYADLAGSTQLQKDYNSTFSARAVRMYLGGSSEIIRQHGGAIKSFDGDRVMGVFTGGSKRNDSVRAAFAINWLVKEVIAPLVRTRHEDAGCKVWVPDHGIGIDCGEVFVARAGVRNKPNEHNHNDLVFIGRAPNVAAKLSAIREANEIIVTHDVYSSLSVNQKKRLNSDTNPWRGPTTSVVGPYSLSLYKTGYWRKFGV